MYRDNRNRYNFGDSLEEAAVKANIKAQALVDAIRPPAGATLTVPSDFTRWISEYMGTATTPATSASQVAQSYKTPTTIIQKTQPTYMIDTSGKLIDVDVLNPVESVMNHITKYAAYYAIGAAAFALLIAQKSKAKK
jgi:hypothetical protein